MSRSLLRLFVVVVVGAFFVMPASAQVTAMPYMQFQGASQYFTGDANMGPYAWVDPSQVGAGRAVIGGQESTTQLLVCRAAIQGAYHPGKYFAGHCNIGYGGQEMVVTQGVQILVNNLQTNMAAQLQMFPQLWAAPAATTAGFVGGTVGGTAMRVCRAAYNGGVHPGKEWAGNCNIGWGTKEVPVTPYEVLSLYNGAKLAAAITKQINSVGTNDKVTSLIELVTVVDYPGVLTAQSLQRPPGFNIIASSVNNQSCLNTPGTQCKQRWSWTLDPTTNCMLNGAYEAVFAKSCTGGANVCGAGTQGIIFNLQSENFCSSTTVTTTSTP